MVFEGVDAGGKGGAIRRITGGIDARLYRTIPVAAPTDEEKAHHYLWRFWRHLPRAGHITIYDRSWYGRVLVERVEGFATDDGVAARLLGDQRLRGTARRERHDRARSSGSTSQPGGAAAALQGARGHPAQAHKITDEDWRNREKWADYEPAVNEMVARTSTDYAPWTLVDGNDKRYARVKVVRTVCDALRKALKNEKGKFTPVGVTRCGDQIANDNG